MRPKTLTLRGAAAADDDAFATAQSLAQLAGDEDGIATSQPMRADEPTTPAAGDAALTEDTPITQQPDLDEIIPPRRLVFGSLADLSGVNFTIDGVDENGEPILEVIEGPEAGPGDDADAIVDEESLNDPEAVELTLEAAAAELDPARRITFSSSSDLSGITFTVTGLDAYGEPQVQNYNGPNNGSDTTDHLWSSITKIEADGTGSGDIDIGWANVLSRKFTDEHYAKVNSITPDASLAEAIVVFIARSDQVMPLTLNGAEGSGELDPPRRIAITWAAPL